MTDRRSALIQELRAEIEALRDAQDNDDAATTSQINLITAAREARKELTITKAELVLTVGGKKEKVVVEAECPIDEPGKLLAHLGTSACAYLRTAHPPVKGLTPIEMINDLRRRSDERRLKIEHLYARLAQLRGE